MNNLRKKGKVSLFCKNFTNFVAANSKQREYGFNNFYEHSAELPALDGTLDEQQTVARRPPLRGSEG